MSADGDGDRGRCARPERAEVMSVRPRECTERHFPVCLRPADGVTVTSGEVHDTEEERERVTRGHGRVGPSPWRPRRRHRGWMDPGLKDTPLLASDQP